MCTIVSYSAIAGKITDQNYKGTFFTLFTMTEKGAEAASIRYGSETLFYCITLNLISGNIVNNINLMGLLLWHRGFGRENDAAPAETYFLQLLYRA
jgi:hypothetical protein